MTMRILVISLQVGAGASKGHLNPLVGVAQWLMAGGHHVGWLPLPAAMGEADQAQLKTFGIEPMRAATPPGLLPGPEILAELARDPQRVWQAYRYILLDPVEPMVDGVRAVLDEFQPDVAMIDTMSYPGIIACHLNEVPWVGVCAGLKLLHPPGFSPAYRGDMAPLVQPRAELFARYGMFPDFRLFECPSPVANIVFGTTELVGAANPPAHTRLVGPSIPPRRRGDEPDFPFDQLPADRPVVYLSLGSVHTGLEMDVMVDALVSATGRLGAALVVSSASTARRTDLPDHVLAVPYAPQLQLLERVDAFVTHGGANSVMEGMYHGVPLLVVPLASDQPMQADLVRRAGAGLALERDQIDPDSAHDALARLLDPNGPIRRSVTRIQASYRGGDGAREAARIVCAAAGSRG
ncbi:MAG TPA: glycosyltransferase [Actinophytocola sp.]|uniref:glycosyltransferase n=1 Tax=Actinophytocola sp. TaxID=1872138 RepID=UPI002DC032F2|nr:glycosyltransferase [Actinophytocola sp.]HEU5475314.1 glycosyltransferase [Actinophytocola sp.]